MLVDDTMKPRELVQEWLSTCVSHHGLCQNGFTGEVVTKDPGDSIRPGRLIKTFEKGGRVTQPSPKLINYWIPADSYVALSHCWGSLDKRPLCTTRANLDQHLLQIPWQDLPQTFQDSILLCIELSIEYLWIDSLCIVQDDEDDWRGQSQIMEQIYERALFTIAASSATDSTKGLFKVRNRLDLVKMPYHNQKIGETDRVFGYIEPDLERYLSSSPLSQRAWVMQEYFLSRRAVHFTTHGLIWLCKNGKRLRMRHMMSEFGSSWEKVFEDDWRALVQSYTRRELAYKSDKLVAIQGLSGQFERRRNKRSYGYWQGLWLQDLPYDLLWYSEVRLARDVGNGIPSWSWASTTGPIAFKASVFEDPEVFHIEIAWGPANPNLHMKALVRRIDDL
jgi:hypothetical protein